MTISKIGTKIDKLHEIREKIRTLDEQAKELRKKRETMELDILQQMNNEKLESAKGSKATLSISHETVPQVADWDEALKWIRKQNKLYMFERRISAKTFREELESRKNKPIPGMVPYTKTKINLRTVKS